MSRNCDRLILSITLLMCVSATIIDSFSNSASFQFNHRGQDVNSTPRVDCPSGLTEISVDICGLLVEAPWNDNHFDMLRSCSEYGRKVGHQLFLAGWDYTKASLVASHSLQAWATSIYYYAYPNQRFRYFDFFDGNPLKASGRNNHLRRAYQVSDFPDEGRIVWINYINGRLTSRTIESSTAMIGLMCQSAGDLVGLEWTSEYEDDQAGQDIYHEYQQHGPRYQTRDALSKLECLSFCTPEPTCRAVYFNPDTNKCVLMEDGSFRLPQDLRNSIQWTKMVKISRL